MMNAGREQTGDLDRCYLQQLSTTLLMVYKTPESITTTTLSGTTLSGLGINIRRLATFLMAYIIISGSLSAATPIALARMVLISLPNESR